MTTSRARRALFATLGAAALLIGGWACHSGGGGAGGNGTTSSACGTGGSALAADGGSCGDPNAPAPPQKSCTCDGDIAKECPLPPSVSDDDGTYTTVYYYANPQCVAGLCRYCVTSTSSEDPGATGAP
jgi:hypothetical protein